MIVAVFACRTQATLAGAVAMLKCLPEKLNPVIKPLMESIKKEENEQLQVLLLYLYRARDNITQLSIPTHAQLRHGLKFIKNHLKNSCMFQSSTIFRELQRPR